MEGGEAERGGLGMGAGGGISGVGMCRRTRGGGWGGNVSWGWMGASLWAVG